MKYALPILPFLFISILTSTVSNAQEDSFSGEYCAGIYKAHHDKKEGQDDAENKENDRFFQELLIAHGG